MEMTETVQTTTHVGKGQVVHNVPKVIKELQFGVLSVSMSFYCSVLSDSQTGQVRTLSIKRRSKYQIAASSTSTKAELSIFTDRLILVWASLASVMNVGLVA